jgi:MoaD family protein
MAKGKIRVTVQFLKPFRDIVGKGSITVEMPRGSVSDLLAELCRLHPKLEPEILDGKGEIGEYVNIFVNDKPLSAFREGVKRKLADGDELLFFFPISGG